MSKKRFIIHCTTNWCGMDNNYPALANDKNDLIKVANEKAIDNLFSYVSETELAEEQDIYEDDYDDYDEYLAELDKINPFDYADATIESFTGTDEDWNILVKNYGLLDMTSKI